ncbi:MAG TPA: RIP metalloprotease RseP, partial [Ferruginibacter sp.]|nr:RIP metalloprotease RseP [Ferruginibacter sp.]
MTLLAINAGNVAMQVFYLILSLSILVILHEFGHYITAKWFKCRVEKFYLFFDPWFSLVKKKIGDTEYGIGWLPLGGYVKISGMIDESMDKEAMQLPPKEYEFRAKPAWQRLIIMLAGIIVNVLLAFVIYAMILFVWGSQKIVNSSVKEGIWIQDSALYKFNLHNGDKIVSIDGKPIQYFDEITQNLLLAKTAIIERDGKQTNITLPEDLLGQLVENKPKAGLSLLTPRLPSLVGEYDPKDTTLGGKKAGLKFMDNITSIDSVPVHYFDELAAVLSTKKNQKVSVQLERQGKPMSLQASVDEDGKIGIPTLSVEQYDSLGLFKIQTKKYGFFEAIPAGIGLAIDRLTNYVRQFGAILNPKSGGAKGLSGFKGIASNFPTQWGDWETFWLMTGFLSIALAF